MNEDLLFLLRTYELIHDGDKEMAVESLESYINGNLYILQPSQFIRVKRIPKLERDKVYKEFIGVKEDVYFALQWTDGLSVRNHGVFRTIDQALDSINVWWELNKFKPRYVRTWEKDGVTTVDYGFHEMFYHIKEVSSSSVEEVIISGGMNIGK